MADNQTAPQVAPSAPAGSQQGRGRGGRRGGRGGRGGRSVAARPAGGDSVPSYPDAVSHVVPTMAQAPSDAGSQGGPHRGGRGGRPRGDGARRGRGGRPIVQTSNLGPRRTFGGRLTTGNEDAALLDAEPSLSAAAPEFVPGQPVVTAKPQPRQSNRHNGTGSGLTGQQRQTVRNVPQQSQPKSTAQDLPTRIHEDIDRGHYECVICTSEVVRSSRIWSCTICWTVTHMHCVKKWHKNQLQQQQDNANQNSQNQASGWRCPGCNSSLQDEPGLYHCWCGKEVSPKSIPGLSPHSCGQTCTKQKPTCPHPCSLTCHAGPCPPCTLMGPTQTCYCGKNTSRKRCTETDYGKGYSCQKVCGDLLPCGEHTCSRPCHSGLCGGCEIPIPSVCYCGKEMKNMPCDQRGDARGSYNYGQLVTTENGEATPSWFEGCFECSHKCGRKFDCDFHTCEKPCHPQDDEPTHCPLSPDVVARCPCGKTSLLDISEEPRTSCRDPISHCDKPCDKVLPCGHHCPNKCHTGACSPCFQMIEISCRCSRTTVKSVCHQGDVQQPMCFRTCRAQLNCGRHECGERCCPGEKKAMERRKQKRTANAQENIEAEHICLNACGRTLRCGTHTCEQLCHRGQCPSCLEAVFDEISCSCGRTVLQPPQPCGTRPPECRFDCTRPRPCGHPIVSHQCHPDDVPCPKCPFLVEKPCICGKKLLKNQPCWFDAATCGMPCGKKLKCGAHECRKLCHRPGECEDAAIPGSHCAQPCGKVRKSCDHTCADTCHAPYPCHEDKPCQSKTFITCPCQHRKKEIRCGATWTSPPPQRDTLECDDECLRLQRNRRLADALNVDPDHTDDHVPYSDTTLKLYSDNSKWAQQQEREFRVFASDVEEKRIRFKPMPANQRAFIHSLAEDFGLDSESQDPEPHRHVAVFKTPRFVSAPKKTLAQCVRAVVKPVATPVASRSSSPGKDSFNALLLSSPRFGITIDEIDAALVSDLASARKSAPTITFTTTFLSETEVVIESHVRATAAAVATAVATPQAVDGVLRNLKSSVAKTVATSGVAGAVSLCRVDSESKAITKREGGPDSAGWNAVASRGPWRRGAAPVKEEKKEVRKGFGFVALRRLGERKEVKKEVVEDDWEAAAERMDETKENDVPEEQEEVAGRVDVEA